MHLYNNFIRLFFITASLVSQISCNQFQDNESEGPLPKTKPNIVFIYTDDQAAWALGESGDPNAYTPNLNSLASQGAYFPNAYVTTPVCSPARVSLLTGQYASEYGVTDFIPPPGHQLYDPNQEVAMSPNSITFPEILQTNGYHTGLVGKWHVGDWLNDPSKIHHPTNNGYDYFMGLTGGGAAPKDPILEEDGVVKKIDGYTTNILTDRAIEFVKRNKDKPFLLSVHYRAPHGRWLPVPDEDWAPYDSIDPVIPNPGYPDLKIPVLKKRMKEYLASTSGVDRNVGKLMQVLKHIGLEENTIIIFTSDHGYNMGHHGIEHKGNGIWATKTPHPAKGNIARNSRPNLFNTSLRVPVLIKWPGVIKPGRVYEENISNLDWYPTIAEMTNSHIPPEKTIRGESLVPLFRGDSLSRNSDVYAEYQMVNYSRAYMRSYSTGEWKLVKDFLNPERDELYHLTEDSVENNNIISKSNPEIDSVKQILSSKILAKMKEIGDPLLKRLPIKNQDLKQ